ncbi:MAG: hypothetical protein J6S74_02655 [Alphaproteobacteria bacterium]|nr:hypothetical protein [Alphaproteobacteria bacterium]
MFVANAAVACDENEIDVTGNGTNCQPVKFTLTTTNLAANGQLNIWMSAKGTFYIDCGDKGTLSGTGTSGKTLTKSTNLVSEISCKWSAAGEHTIRFGGIATEYASVGLDASSTNSAIQFGTSGNQQKIATISGSLGEMFPQLGSGANQVPSFASLFDGASNLRAVPSTLFSGLTGSANAKYMFHETFANCTSLTSIPADLFADITTPAEHMFNKTFDGDTNLSGFIPSTAFAGLIANGSPTAANMWADTFQNTGLATACPSGSIQYETQYETSWGDKLSCICAGANFFDNALNACTPCPSGYDYDTTNGKTDVGQCQIQCVAGTYVETPGVYGYTVLEYLESPGDAYIDTGFVHNSDNIRGEFRVGVGENVASAKNFNIIGNQTAVGGYSVGWADNQFKIWVVATGARLRGPDHPLTQDGVYDIAYEFKNGRQYLTDGNDTRDMAHDGGIVTTTSIHLFDNGIHEMAYNFKGRVYWIRLYENNVLVHNFLPVRQDGTDKIGIYDTVTGRFFTNSNANSVSGFTYGGDLSNNCVDSGRGYYVGQSVTNFGNVGERVPCPIGTYSDSLRGASIAVCQDCQGATYNDVVGAAACTACPVGYTDNTDSGKTSKRQCETTCPGGTYMASDTINGYTKLDYIEANGKQWINTGIFASSLVNPIMKLTTQYTAVEKGKQNGAKKNNLDFKVGISNGSVFLCQAGGSNTETKFGAADTAKHTFILDTGTQTCTLDGETKPLAVGNLTDGPISIGTVNNQSGNAGKQKIFAFTLISNGVKILDLIPVRDANGVAGMYDVEHERFYQSAGTLPFVEGPLSNTGGCIDVEPGYWAPETVLGYGQTNDRNECPAGLTTVGYGHGADELADCARELHLAGHVIYAKQTKDTTRALNLVTNTGTTFYIGLSSTDHTLSNLHLSDGVSQYTAYDDSLLYGERNFTTGARIQ